MATHKNNKPKCQRSQRGLTGGSIRTKAKPKTVKAIEELKVDLLRLMKVDEICLEIIKAIYSKDNKDITQLVSNYLLHSDKGNELYEFFIMQKEERESELNENV